jgi:PAS domain S-box-containing protein
MATSPLAQQAAFFRQLPADQPLRTLFDHLGDVAFCIKDRASRVMCANRAVLAKFGLTHERDIIGTSDADRYPARLAEVFRASDREVMERGQAVLDRLEVWYTPEGALDWCLVTKLPLRDRRGTVIGVMMVMRPWSGARRRLSHGDALGEAIEAIRASPGQPWRVTAIARRIGCTPRHLHRRFLSEFGIGAKEFILRTRIQAAAELLRHHDQPLGDIASTCGFHDQSAFTRTFRAHTGMTPHRFRRQQRG